MKVKHLYLENGEVNPSAFEKNVVIWGAGNDGRKLLAKLSDEEKSRVICFWDSAAGSQLSDIGGIPVEHTCDTWAFENTNLVLAFSKWDQAEDFVDSQEFPGGEVYADQPWYHESPVKCIVCGGECYESKAHFAPFIQEREFGGKPPETKLIICRDCGMAFSRYRPDDTEMERLYAGYRDEHYFTRRHFYEPQYSREDNERTLSDENINQRRRIIVDFIKSIVDISSIRSVLDYGGDEGQMIPAEFTDAQRTVFEVSGNRVLPGISLINNLTELCMHRFDFIMCCQLLEHVSDPIQIIRNMIDVLAPGGYLYIEVPDEKAYLRYSDYAFHEHINFFTEKSLIIGGRNNLDMSYLKSNTNSMIQICLRKPI